jgi:hypothetical protein
VDNLDACYTFDDPHSGQTTAHVFSELVHSLTQLHDDIARKKALCVSKTLRETSVSLYRLQKKIKGEADQGRRQEMHEEIVRLQQNLKTDLEAKDTASRLRIKNFYRTRIGKMLPETFHCIKETKSNRDINTLLVDGALVTDPERIVSVMQHGMRTRLSVPSRN